MLQTENSAHYALFSGRHGHSYLVSDAVCQLGPRSELRRSQNTRWPRDWKKELTRCGFYNFCVPGVSARRWSSSAGRRRLCIHSMCGERAVAPVYYPRLRSLSVPSRLSLADRFQVANGDSRRDWVGGGSLLGRVTQFRSGRILQCKIHYFIER